MKRECELLWSNRLALMPFRVVLIVSDATAVIFIHYFMRYTEQVTLLLLKYSLSFFYHLSYLIQRIETPWVKSRMLPFPHFCSCTPDLQPQKPDLFFFSSLHLSLKKLSSFSLHSASRIIIIGPNDIASCTNQPPYRSSATPFHDCAIEENDTMGSTCIT